MVMAPTITSSVARTTPTQDAIHAAQKAELEARAKQIAAARAAQAASGSYLNTQSSANQAARQDTLGIQAAAANTADKIAVAREQQERNSGAYLYGLAGLQPIDVEVAPGTDVRNMGPGIRAALQTQEQVLTQRAANNEAIRGFDVTDSRLNLARSTDAAQAAGLDVDAARLQGDRAKTAPAAGLVYDDEDGTFVTPSQYRINQAERGLVYDEINRTYVTRDQLSQYTDKLGNVLRSSDGTWVDPKSGNEYINGIWTDPRSGNQLIDGVWTDTSGNKLIDGYWTNPQGFRMVSGFWTHPVSGARIINGQVVTSGSSGGGLDLSGLFGGDSNTMTPIVGADGSLDLSGIFPTGPLGSAAAQQGGGNTTLNGMANLPQQEAITSTLSSLFPPNQLQNAAAIMMAESGGNPAAIGAAGEVGLFQIHPSNFAGLTRILGIPINAQTLLDPATNIRAAYAIWQATGTWSNDWTTAAGLGIA